MTIFSIRKSPFWACLNFWKRSHLDENPSKRITHRRLADFRSTKMEPKVGVSPNGIQRRGTLNPLHNKLRARDKPGISLPQAYCTRLGVQFDFQKRVFMGHNFKKWLYQKPQLFIGWNGEITMFLSLDPNFTTKYQQVSTIYPLVMTNIAHGIDGPFSSMVYRS